MLFIDNKISVFCIVSKSLFRFAAVYIRNCTTVLNFSARYLVLVRFTVKVFVQVHSCIHSKLYYRLKFQCTLLGPGEIHCQSLCSGSRLCTMC